MNKIRLVVVDDHALFRAGLISILQELADIEVVGDAGDGQAALDIIERTRPQVILLDVNMPGMGGVDTVRALRSRPSTHDCKILMLTISKSEDDLFGAIQAGADGYLLKNVEPEELHRAIINIQQGLSVLSPQVTRQVLGALQTNSSHQEPLLSEREMEVLRCLARGNTTLQTASLLVISENTVKTHVRHILEKLQAANRAEAVSKALQMGLLPSSD